MRLTLLTQAYVRDRAYYNHRLISGQLSFFRETNNLSLQCQAFVVKSTLKKGF